MSAQPARPSSSYSASSVVGRTEPRLWTRPLRDLTPETSYGFAVVEFARDVLGRPLDPWQEWLVIHAGELLPDGRPRFRKVLVLVARQNGKTELCVVLVLYWLFVEMVALVLGTSTNLDYARESWEKAVMLAETVDDLAREIPSNGIRRANGEQTLSTIDRCRYKIAASNRKGGRSLTVGKLVLDELREHRDWSAWNAAYPAMNAVRDGQAYAISNQGDAESVVLDSLREAALDFIETGEGDYRLGLFEYSSPDGSNPTDIDALAYANPNLGRRIDVENLIGDAIRAQEKGGKELAGFLTENMCIKVDQMDSAIDLRRWKRLGDADMEWPDVGKRRRFAAFEVSEDMQHATLEAGVYDDDGNVRVRVRKAWTSSEDARAELLDVLQELDPCAVAWFPTGPAAAFASILRPTTKGRPLPGRIESVELTGGRVTEACQGLADLIKAGGILHPDDPLIDAHLRAARKQHSGDGWRFVRRDGGHIDAAYATAGVVHLALTRPNRQTKIRVIT